MAKSNQDENARQAYGRAEETETQTRRERGPAEGRETTGDASAEDALTALRDNGPDPTNLDRALPAGERRRARVARRGGEARPDQAEAAPPEHFVVVLDRAHLNIYRVREAGPGTRARFERVEAITLVAGTAHYTDRDADQAGRFGARVGPGGGSIDERLPMQNEHERRLVADLAERLRGFLEKHARATWDYAAGPALHHAVLDRLPPAVLERLIAAVPKELVHQTPAELEAHFTP